MTAAELTPYLSNQNVIAFLRLLREGETTQSQDAYRWLFGSIRSHPKLFDKYDDHPRVRTYEKYDGQFIKNGKIDYTTAAGAYQITESTWDTVVQPALKLPDFSPVMQDVAAVYLVRRAKALDDVLAGRIEAAIQKCRGTWASLPGAAFGDQPTVELERSLNVYDRYGGMREHVGETKEPMSETNPPLAETPAPESETIEPVGETPAAPSIPAGEAGDWPPPSTNRSQPVVAPIIAAVASPLISSLADALIDAFTPAGREKLKGVLSKNGGDPEVAGRIVNAVVDAAKTVTKQVDPMAAVVAAKSDPAVLRAVEDDALERLAKMQPLLDKIAEWESKAAEREAAEREAASARYAREMSAGAYDMTKPLLGGAFVGVGIVMLTVGGIAIAQAIKTGTVDKEILITLSGLIGWVTAKAGTIYDYRFGGVSRTTAAQIVRDEIAGPRK